MNVKLLMFNLPIYPRKGDTPEDFVGDFEEILPPGLENLGDGDGIVSSVGFDTLLEGLISAFRYESGGVLAFFLLLIGFSVLIAIAELSSELFDARLSSGLRTAVGAVTTFSIFSPFVRLVAEAGESFSALSDFFSALIPIITGLTAFGGAGGTAGVAALNMNISLSVIGRVVTELLLPLTTLVFSLSMVSFSPDGGGTGLAGAVRSAFLFIIGAVSTLLLASAGIQSFLTSSYDSITLRTVKYAVSGSIPIVSGTVSGAFSALCAAVSGAITSIGCASVVVILSLVSVPLISMLLYRFALTLSLAFLNFLGVKWGSQPISALRSAFDLLIAVYIMSALVYIIEIAIVMKCGVKLFG